MEPVQRNGSIMIRPVVGAPVTTSINDVTIRNKLSLHIWPNPASDYLYLDPVDDYSTGLTYISFIDMQGHIIMKVPYNEMINISSLPDGFYIVIATLNSKTYGYSRLIKIK